jgi:hypothetical protein
MPGGSRGPQRRHGASGKELDNPLLYGRWEKGVFMANYFGVKTFIVTRSKGPPKIRDPFFHPDFELLEERVLLVKAPSFGKAIERAKRATEEYCKRSYVSVYDQKISLVPLRYVDCYEISGGFPGFKGKGETVFEIFSTIGIIDKKEPIKDILNRKTGVVRENEEELRFKFLEKEMPVKRGKAG